MDSKDAGGPRSAGPLAHVIPAQTDARAALETARQMAARQGSGVVVVVHLSPEDHVPDAHPIRAIRRLTDDLLREMSREFDGLYAKVGRPSVPPERLLRAHLLEILYSIPNARLLLEQLDYNLLFRWFVGLATDEPLWAPAEFSENLARLADQPLTRLLARRLFDRAGTLTADERFTVNRTFLGEGAA